MSALEHRHLRSALEFAVLMAAEGQKRRPPIAYPKELKPYFGARRIPGSALGRIRRAIEADDRFRGAISAGALPELVDEVGRCWLAQGEGWDRQIEELLDEHVDDRVAQDEQHSLQRAEKRRQAAEQAAARTRVDLLQQQTHIDAQRTEIDVLQADLVKAQEAVDEMRSELIDTRNEARHARDRETAARERLEALIAREPDASDQVPVELDVQPGPDRDALEAALDAANILAEQLAALVPDVDADRTVARGPGPRRRPLAIPSGVISTSAEAAEHMVRADAAILVDGYNVAMLGWPNRSLEQQRDALIAGAENLARRHAADITLVFDGASVVGAHASARRTVRVVYSPADVTADDVIRAEVGRLPIDRAVVVVTNDREIVADVRVAGANVVPSNAFLALL